MSTTADDDMSPEAVAAEVIANELEQSGAFVSVDWNDLGEVTVQINGRTFRATIADITDEE